MPVLPSFSPWGHFAAVVAGLLVYVVVSRAQHQRRQPASALAWVMTIAILPYFGTPLFLIFGTRKVARPATRTPLVTQRGRAPKAPLWATQLLAAMGIAAPQANARIAFHGDGAQSLTALLGVLRSARQTLDVCTYILGNDAVGDAVAAALAERAQSGVRVRLLVDAVGSLQTLHSHDAVLHPAGVQYRVFMPLLGRPRGHVNLRNHRKWAVADGSQVWSGGRNLAREYFLGMGHEPPWIDLSFTAQGPLAAQAQTLFEGDWELGRALAPKRTQRPAPPSLPPAPAPPPGPGPASDTAQQVPGALAQWVPSGPDFHEDTLHALLMSAVFRAEQRLLLVTPYFVPDEALLEALLLAVKRGVRLLLVLPARSNHRMADWARGRAMRALAAAGAQVCLLPRMLHAKAIVVDEVLALCGSANLDCRSFFLNFEAMAAFYDRTQIDWLAQWAESTASQGQRAPAATPGWVRDLLEGVVGTLAFQL
ncbi:phospholipase D-like domain-containing protein [Extensimonas vulgaris]|jgi:cardiolipin synthase|uniref:Cardiolipin synthase n=1 Tax=Extensimonas vulgaris TaxID=1031594 RepID=A0A369ALT5_9BURK|nr:phospholipase D-like domain-containing protein [Extensimonas vulgaris]RCX09127.1 cardiolipin synthase [Extensimonas vulgaris]TWI37710.1 cardiolipin synthase [Extensimonas vulgaris]TXD15974.1 cardiolipin synthase [Extensimonas vulgaris]